MAVHQDQHLGRLLTDILGNQVIWKRVWFILLVWSSKRLGWVSVSYPLVYHNLSRSGIPARICCLNSPLSHAWYWSKLSRSEPCLVSLFRHRTIITYFYYQLWLNKHLFGPKGLEDFVLRLRTLYYTHHLLEIFPIDYPKRNPISLTSMSYFLLLDNEWTHLKKKPTHSKERA